MASGKTRSTADRELDAIGVVLRALDGLDGESIQRVLDYVFSRLSIAVPLRTKATAPPSAMPQLVQPDSRTRRPSIRDLKEAKQPESANQMAALVAYYLSEEADGDERKDAIAAADLERYFKQAGFKLPKSPAQTLVNAAAAGYFDAIGNGQYRLNAVGYNLAVHGLPRPHRGDMRVARRSRKKAPSKKRS